MLHRLALSNFEWSFSSRLKLGDNSWKYLVVVIEDLVLDETLLLIELSNVHVFVGFELRVVKASSFDLQLIQAFVNQVVKLVSIINATLIEKRL